jgi:hypothetical protein
MWLIRFGVLGVVFIVYYIYAFTALFTVTAYDVQGVPEEARARINTELLNFAKKKRYLIVPSDKIFTYGSSGIITIIRKNITDAGVITMRPVGLHTVRISVAVLIPVLKLNETEALSENGIIFTPAKIMNGYPHIAIASSTRKVVKIEGLPFTQLYTGDTVVDDAYLKSVLFVSTQVTSLIFPVASISIEELGDVTLYSAGEHSKVMFLRNADPKKVWSTLVSAIDTEPLKSKLANDTLNLLYLDARYGNKVFYRFDDMMFQNTEDPDILNRHETSTSSTLPSQH